MNRTDQVAYEEFRIDTGGAKELGEDDRCDHLHDLMGLRDFIVRLERSAFENEVKREESQQSSRKRYVKLAEKACSLTGSESHDFLDTLAMAYAAAGRFEVAVKTEQDAIRRANAARQPNAAQRYEARLVRFIGLPYHTLDLCFVKTAGRLDANLLFFARCDVPRRYMDNPVRIDIEGHLDLGHASRRGRYAMRSSSAGSSGSASDSSRPTSSIATTTGRPRSSLCLRMARSTARCC